MKTFDVFETWTSPCEYVLIPKDENYGLLTIFAKNFNRIRLEILKCSLTEKILQTLKLEKDLLDQTKDIFLKHNSMADLKGRY